IRWVTFLLAVVPPEPLVRDLGGELVLFQSYAFLVSSLCAIACVLNSFLKLATAIEFNWSKPQVV
ncbi:MAG TPA: hypothetical protein PK869_00425, partial [Candidatus Hydrogenedentes bacterium]|nr:hypothetical protein [Candidatus Hydrogenedentota bacterium]